MLTIDEKTTVVGVSELRGDIAKVLREAKKHKVVLTRRNKPVGVLLDYAEYERMKLAEEELEDLALARLADAREKRKGKKTVSLEEAERLLGVR